MALVLLVLPKNIFDSYRLVDPANLVKLTDFSQSFRMWKKCDTHGTNIQTNGDLFFKQWSRLVSELPMSAIYGHPFNNLYA